MGHWNKEAYRLLGQAMEDQVRRSPFAFASDFLLQGLQHNAHPEMQAFYQTYTSRGIRRPHAEWIAHREITHTLRTKFPHLVVKVGECPNPKGGTMSRWNRI
jgi:hypothetical protein